METLVKSVTTQEKKELPVGSSFWFLEKTDEPHIAHNLRFQNYSFGTVCLETLGSGAEGKRNEDSFLALPMGWGRTLFAVFDGASSQKKIEGLDGVGVSGAFYISHLSSLGFEDSSEYQELFQRPSLTAKDTMMAMNSWLHDNLKQIKGIDYSDPSSVPGMAAAFILVDVPGKRVTLAQVADCGVAVADTFGGVRMATPNLNEKFDEETMNYARELSRAFNSDLSKFRHIPEAKELLRQQLIESFHKKTNKKGGCGIMNGMVEVISNNLIYTDSILLDDNLASILMFSDGAILPYMEEGVSIDTAVKKLASVVKDSDHKSALEIGSSILESDTDFSKVPRMKLKDDATLISINFDVKSIHNNNV